MRRATFLAAAAATLVARPARAASDPLGDLIAAFPGTVGIYARTLSGGPPYAAIRGDETFASASVIKLVVMTAAYRAYDAGDAHPDKPISLRAADLIGGSPVLGNARAGDRYPLHTLVDAMIRWSDNSAANTLITSFGIAAINATARDIGMTGTTLARHFADNVPANQPNLNLTTPNDVGTLLYEIERGAHEGVDTVARSISCRAMVNVLLGQQYREMIPAGIARRVPIANKTGDVDGVRNDAAIVDPFGESPYVLVVLSRDLADQVGGELGISAIARRVDSVLGRL